MNNFLIPALIVTYQFKQPNLSVYYPMAKGLSNSRIQQGINNVILDRVNRLVIQQGYYQNPDTEITGWFEVKNNQRGILSLNIGNYGYPPGAAHGMTYIKSVTFDIYAGKLYQLKDLFKPGSDYVKVLSEIIQRQIKERDIPLLDGFTSIKPDQDFYIADKSLVIYFQLYEITPYYVGLPMFPISVFDIQDIITDDGPLGRMATNS